MSINKEVRDWRAIARDHGWDIRRGGSHERWYAPDKETIVTVSTTHQPPRCLRNVRAKLRATGLPV